MFINRDRFLPSEFYDTYCSPRIKILSTVRMANPSPKPWWRLKDII